MKKTIFALIAAFAASVAIAAPADIDARAIDTSVPNVVINFAGDVAQADTNQITVDSMCTLPECDQW